MTADEAITLPERPRPFWSYLDVLLFLGLAVPSLLVASFLVQGLAALFTAHPPNKATLGLYAQFISYAFWMASLWLILKTRYDAIVPLALAWVIPRRGLAGSVLAGPVLAFGVAIIAQMLHMPQIEDPFLKLVSGRLSILILGTCVVVLGPVFEELLFRGLVLPLLVRDLGVVAGILATAIPFALLHGPQYSWQWQHVVLITMVGCTLGAVRYATRSTLASTVMHAAYNATLFAGYLAELIRRSAL